MPDKETQTWQQTMKMRILPDALDAILSRVKPQRVEAANGNQTPNTIVECRGQQADLAAKRVAEEKDAR